AGLSSTRATFSISSLPGFFAWSARTFFSRSSSSSRAALARPAALAGASSSSSSSPSSSSAARSCSGSASSSPSLVSRSSFSSSSSLLRDRGTPDLPALPLPGSGAGLPSEPHRRQRFLAPDARKPSGDRVDPPNPLASHHDADPMPGGVDLVGAAEPVDDSQVVDPGGEGGADLPALRVGEDDLALRVVGV